AARGGRVLETGLARRVRNLDLHYAFARCGEAELAVLDGEGLVAEQLAAPALERGNVRIVVEHQGVDVVRGGDNAGRDAVFLAHRLEQDAHQVADGALGRRPSIPL